MPDPNISQRTQEAQQHLPWLQYAWTMVVLPFLHKDVRDIAKRAFKWVFDRIVPNVQEALRLHEIKDDERFSDVKQRISESEQRILDALKENVQYLREDLKTERESTEKRVQFLETVFLDSRLDKR